MSMGAHWPASVFTSPLLRALDDRGRRELAAAGQLLQLEAGKTLFRRGERGQVLFLLVEGELLLTSREGEGASFSHRRRVRPGEICGEEAGIGAVWWAHAVARTASRVAEIPVPMLRRVSVRSGGNEFVEELEQQLRHRARVGLLAQSALSEVLTPAELEALAGEFAWHDYQRDEVVYRQGELSSAWYLVVDGMVRLERNENERLRVGAYLTRGDFFGQDELRAGLLRSESALASGTLLLLSLSASRFRQLVASHPPLWQHLIRDDQERNRRQRDAAEGISPAQTGHPFHDVERLRLARSLLVIDLDSCVRCGHCAWRCEATHGVARLVRRGDKVALVDSAGGPPGNFLLPRSCHHCDEPACLPDCPTGAITREPGGLVQIRESLCTACEACVKACPWDNIQIVPRRAKSVAQASSDSLSSRVAVKCDLCVGRSGPACIEACPTDAIHRIVPRDNMAGLRKLLHTSEPAAAPKRVGTSGRAVRLTSVGIASAVLALAGIVLHARGQWVAWRGPAWAMGIAATLCLLILVGYSVPKRLVHLPIIESWWRRRRGHMTMQRHLEVHSAVGMLALALMLAHGGGRVNASTGGALQLAIIICSLLGGLTALIYAVAPAWLTRVERQPLLPEDRESAQQQKYDQLYAAMSGCDPLLKRLFERVMLDYLNAPLGAVRLILSGRKLADEERRMRTRIDSLLQGRGAQRLQGLSLIISLLVELRALRAQRLLSRVLRGGLPLHILAASVSVTLLVVHIIEGLAR